MSQVKQGSGDEAPQDNTYWRSVGQLENTQEYRKFLYREFQENASVLEDPITRRTFIKLMGASAALAGLSGCTIRKQEQLIQPYAKAPEEVIPGKANYYATAFSLGEDVVGVLAESFEGRPTKIEGNPSHSQSLGAAKVFQQASVLELYDPDRLQKPQVKGKAVSLQAVQELLSSQEVLDAQGEGLAILTETQVSPTFYRALDILRKELPKAKIYRYDPLGRSALIQGIHSVTGEWLNPTYDLEKATVLVGFNSDILGNVPGSVLYTKSFSKRRDPQHPKGMNRLYNFESNVSITGAKADHRIRVKHTQIEPILWALAKALVDRGVISSGSLLSYADLISSGAKLNQAAVSKEIEAIVDDLSKNKGASLLTAGASQPAAVHALVFLINAALGNVGQTLLVRDLNFGKDALVQTSSLDAIKELSGSLDRREVKTLVILGGDPVYTAPADLKFAEKIAKAKTSIHLTLFHNQTTQVATVAIPRQHYLESWSDVQAVDGSTSIVQPLIEPLYPSVQDAELISLLSGGKETAHTLVKSTWNASESQWKRWLHDGVISGPTAHKGSVSVKNVSFGEALQKQVRTASAYKAQDIELTFQPSYAVYDGRFANNGWLQELPDPITKLTWDNAVLLSQKTADALHIKYGDLVTLSTGASTLEAAALIVPGHAHQSLSISLGYGQTKIGRVGARTGFNAYTLRTSQNAVVIPSVSIKKTGKTYALATTQEHGAIDGKLNGSVQGNRHLVREATVAEYTKNPKFAKEAVEHPPLVSSWPEKKYDKGYQWGLSIDLGKCTGCNACVTACQSENNIPIVGKKEVLNGREMHWIRIDRYFEGHIEDARAVMQPMTCLQCELAPCEQVCPVAATTHSEEGLNDMTYNRCVGTRYCANNCPTKVRRFNFFDFHQRNPQAVEKERKHLFDYMKEPDKTVQLQFNPDVTVRMRGMMEKCTYCVQRINQGKITAKNEERDLRDGDIKTACQQTCPATAIVFGNILDPNSEIAKAKALSRDYTILEEWNLKPRTSYVAGIRNPHPSLERVA